MLRRVELIGLNLGRPPPQGQLQVSTGDPTCCVTSTAVNESVKIRFQTSNRRELILSVQPGTNRVRNTQPVENKLTTATIKV